MNTYIIDCKIKIVQNLRYCKLKIKNSNKYI